MNFDTDRYLVLLNPYFSSFNNHLVLVPGAEFLKLIHNEALGVCAVIFIFYLYCLGVSIPVWEMNANECLLNINK